MSKLNIPIVEGEDGKTKNCRLLMTAGAIIISVLILLFVFESSSLDISKIFERCEYEKITTCHYKNHNEPVTMRYVKLYNITKSQIPIDKIVVIQMDGVMIPIYRNKALTNRSKQNGFSITFDVGREVLMRELILDFGDDQNNDLIISTTQVEVQNGEGDTVWYNCDPIKTGGRYVYLYMTKEKLIHPPAREVLCAGNCHSQKSEAEQENIINSILARNTWNNGVESDKKPYF